jgi:plastocyanin
MRGLCAVRFLRNINAVKHRSGPHNFRWRRFELTVAAIFSIALFCTTVSAHEHPAHKGAFFLPTGDAAKILTVTTTGDAAAGITVITEAIAEKETGPKEAVAKFGEIYTFSPEFIAVHRDEPTKIEFWNLQSDDEHDFAILDGQLNVLMYQKLPTLKKTSWVFTFHREGLFGFKCMVHQPEMSGQILVLPPAAP